jgi:hypothetical protein
MPDQFAVLRHEIAVANRILANVGIIDAFGHISARNPKDPNRYGIAPRSWSSHPTFWRCRWIPSRSCRRACASTAKW